MLAHALFSRIPFCHVYNDTDHLSHLYFLNNKKTYLNNM